MVRSLVGEASMIRLDNGDDDNDDYAGDDDHHDCDDLSAVRVAQTSGTDLLHTARTEHI